MAKFFDADRTLGVVITGQKDIDKRLVELPVQLQRHLVREATNKAAKDVVLRTAQQRVPSDTGTLRRQLKVRNIRAGEPVRGRGRRRNRIDTGHRNVIGSQVYARRSHTKSGFWYGSAVELGLKNRNYEATRFLRSSLYDKRYSTTIIFLRAMRKFLGLRQRR